MDTHKRVDENKIIEETRYYINNNVDVYTINFVLYHERSNYFHDIFTKSSNHWNNSFFYHILLF